MDDCRWHHHVCDAEGERAGGRIKSTDHRFCVPGFSLVQHCALQKRKAFPLLMFPAGITPDNCQPSLKPHVIHSVPPFFYYGRLP